MLEYEKTQLKRNYPSSQQRGHIIIYKDNAWRFEDTMEIAHDVRPCAKCKLMPTPEGYDPCLGYLEGVQYACCGHGVDNGYVMIDDQTYDLQGWLDDKKA